MKARGIHPLEEELLSASIIENTDRLEDVVEGILQTRALILKTLKRTALSNDFSPDLNAVDNQGNSALMLAAKSGLHKNVSLLISKIDLLPGHYQKALNLAGKFSPKCLEILLEAKPTDIQIETAFLEAVSAFNLKNVKILGSKLKNYKVIPKAVLLAVSSAETFAYLADNFKDHLFEALPSSTAGDNILNYAPALNAISQKENLTYIRRIIDAYSLEQRNQLLKLLRQDIQKLNEHREKCYHCLELDGSGRCYGNSNRETKRLLTVARILFVYEARLENADYYPFRRLIESCYRGNCSNYTSEWPRVSGTNESVGLEILLNSYKLPNDWSPHDARNHHNDDKQNLQNNCRALLRTYAEALPDLTLFLADFYTKEGNVRAALFYYMKALNTADNFTLLKFQQFVNCYQSKTIPNMHDKVHVDGFDFVVLERFEKHTPITEIPGNAEYALIYAKNANCFSSRENTLFLVDKLKNNVTTVGDRNNYSSRFKLEELNNIFKGSRNEMDVVTPLSDEHLISLEKISQFKKPNVDEDRVFLNSLSTQCHIQRLQEVKATNNPNKKIASTNLFAQKALLEAKMPGVIFRPTI